MGTNSRTPLKNTYGDFEQIRVKLEPPFCQIILDLLGGFDFVHEIQHGRTSLVWTNARVGRHVLIWI